jgi:hypothetical protein
VAGTRRGYEVSDDEVSDTQVTRIVRLLEKSSEQLQIYNDVVLLDTKNRVYIAYFKKVS